KKLGTKCVVDIQDLWPETFRVFFPFKIGMVSFSPIKKYADTIYHSADALIAVSETYTKRALSVCNNNKPFYVLYLGIDLKLFDKYNDNCFPIKKGDNEFWVIYIGTIGRSYDVKAILNAAESLKYSQKNMRFFIAGNGPQLAQMKKIAQNKKLTNCKFLGFVKFENLVELLKNSDVGLNAFVKSGKNSFPNKVFDYMAAGLPIINSIQGELEQLLKLKNIGIQYEAGNAESLKDAILELYNNPKMRKEMGKNARKLVEEKFDKNKTYPKVEKFLQGLVGCGKSS
ncbi:glycosyltransferase family 4 protein, partial [Patescibacteria group bacterium]|nr:glycosyltransferase family 4 protein [Patescibacteria group bacterium]